MWRTIAEKLGLEPQALQVPHLAGPRLVDIRRSTATASPRSNGERAVLRWNEGALGDRGRHIARLMGSEARSASEAVRTLCERLGLPTSLESIGVGADRFRAIAEHAIHDRSVRGNPRPISTPEDIEQILNLAR